jgi:hypothetical protein
MIQIQFFKDLYGPEIFAKLGTSFEKDMQNKSFFTILKYIHDKSHLKVTRNAKATGEFNENALKRIGNFRTDIIRYKNNIRIRPIDGSMSQLKVQERNIGIVFFNKKEFYDEVTTRLNVLRHRLQDKAIDYNNEVTNEIVNLRFKTTDDNYVTMRFLLNKKEEIRVRDVAKRIQQWELDYNKEEFIEELSQIDVHVTYNYNVVPQLTSWGRKNIKKLKGSLFSPCIYNTHICLIEIYAFLTLTVNEQLIMTDRNMQYIYKSAWIAFCTYWASHAKNDNIIAAALSGQTIEFVDLYKEKYNEQLYIYNTHVKTYYPNTPTDLYSKCLVWYDRHSELFLFKDIGSIKYKEFTLKKHTPKPIKKIRITLDIETYQKDENGEQIPYLICIYCEENKELNRVMHHEDRETLTDMFSHYVQELKSDKKNNYVIWAHNGMKFDYIILLKPLILEHQLVINTDTLNNNSSFSVCNIEFKDSFKLLPSSLDKLAKDLINKQKLDFDHKLIREYKDFLTNKDTCIKYCVNDCVILYDSLKVVQQILDELNIKTAIDDIISASSLTLKAFQETFPNNFKLKGHIGELYEDERKSYHGGMTITTMVKDYTEPIYEHDINSCYPHCMTFKMPYKYMKTIIFDKIPTIVPYYLYYIKFKYPNTTMLPILPVELDDKSGIIYPLSGEGWYWGCSIISALKQNCKIEYIKAHSYKGKFVFKDYVERLYSLKVKYKDNSAKTAIIKLLLNSAYGKMGQKLRNRAVITHMNNVYIDQSSWVDWITDNIVKVEYQEDLNRYNQVGSLVRFASYITAQARSVLIEPILVDKSIHLFYCDTDSLYTNKLIPSKFLDETELGKFKMVLREGGGIFISAKTYCLFPNKDRNDAIFKMKGVNKKNIKKEHYYDLLNYNVARIATTMGNREYNKVFIREAIKVITNTYSKRKLLDDGYTIPHLNKEEYLIYHKGIKEFKKQFIEIKKANKNTNSIIVKNNLLNKKRYLPSFDIILEDHEDKLNELDKKKYIQFRLLAYPRFTGTLNVDEIDIIYDYIYKKNDINFHDILSKIWNVKLLNLKVDSNLNILQNLQQNGMCKNWRMDKIGTIKSIYLNRIAHDLNIRGL